MSTNIEIIEFNNESFVLDYLKDCEWNAGKFLYALLNEKRFYSSLGDSAKLFILKKANEVIAFATYSLKDCIDDSSLFPWIGFLYVDPKNRGNSYSKLIIDHILKNAKDDGYKNIYLATDHINFYEKYGFEFLEKRLDVYNEISRIYYYKLA